jgi:hypothetical protein
MKFFPMCKLKKERIFSIKDNKNPQILLIKKIKKNHWWGPLRFDFFSFVMGISVRVHSPKEKALKGVPESHENARV